MAAIIPFSAYRYNSALAGDLSLVLTQPYDKISTEMQQRYYEVSPLNLVRVILRKSEPTEQTSHYRRANETLREWISKKVLVRDPQPAFYAYSQTFDVPGRTNQKLTRTGILALGRLADYGAGIVFPHERTLTGPKKDRLELLRATRAHCEQIFLLYSDPERAVDAVIKAAAEQEPLIEVEDEYAVTNRLWAIDGHDSIVKIQRALRDKKVLIADGHHRYETALAYRDECRSASGNKWTAEAPTEFVPVMLVNSESEGLVILPTHRVVENLPEFDEPAFLCRLGEYFEIQERSVASAEATARFQQEFEEGGKGRSVIGAVFGGGHAALLTVKPGPRLDRVLDNIPSALRDLDVVTLHELVLGRCLGLTSEEVSAGKNLRYIRGLDQTVDQARSGRVHAAFLLNPIRIEQVRAAAFSGLTLPQKSTDFYPKLLSGLAIHILDT